MPGAAGRGSTCAATGAGTMTWSPRGRSASGDAGATVRCAAVDGDQRPAVVDHLLHQMAQSSRRKDRCHGPRSMRGPPPRGGAPQPPARRPRHLLWRRVAVLLEVLLDGADAVQALEFPGQLLRAGHARRRWRSWCVRAWPPAAPPRPATRPQSRSALPSSPPCYDYNMAPDGFGPPATGVERQRSPDAIREAGRRAYGRGVICRGGSPAPPPTTGAPHVPAD